PGPAELTLENNRAVVAVDGDDGAGVLQSELGGAGLGLELDHVLAAMRDGDVDRRVLADRDGAVSRLAPVDADAHVGGAGSGPPEIVDAQHDLGVLADDGETRGVGD